MWLEGQGCAALSSVLQPRSSTSPSTMPLGIPFLLCQAFLLHPLPPSPFPHFSCLHFSSPAPYWLKVALKVIWGLPIAGVCMCLAFSAHGLPGEEERPEGLLDLDFWLLGMGQEI